MTEGAISGTTLQVPTINYHTPNETAALTSVRAIIQQQGSRLPPSPT